MYEDPIERRKVLARAIDLYIPQLGTYQEKYHPEFVEIVASHYTGPPLQQLESAILEAAALQAKLRELDALAAEIDRTSTTPDTA